MENSNIDLKKFYEQIAVANEMFNMVNDGNKKIIEESIEEPETESIKEKEDEITEPALLYLLSYTKNYHAVIIGLFNIMIEKNFKDTPSVNSKFINSNINNSNYEKLATISLYEHTINCTIQIAKTLNFGSETPSSAIGISIVISLLHDFGKSPLIAKNFNTGSNQHHHISANFAKHFLSKFLNAKIKKNRVGQDFIDLVFKTINTHHDKDINQGPFLKILIDGDSKARERELLFYEYNKKLDEEEQEQ